MAGLCALLALSTGAARLAGRMIPASPLYLDDGRCDPPCWQGIMPGTSTFADLEREISARGLFRLAAVGGGGGVVRRFELAVVGEMALGDVVRVWGAPERVSCLGTTHTARFPGRNLATLATLYFADGLIAVEAIEPGSTNRLTPGMHVRLIAYYAPGEPVYPLGAPAWDGWGVHTPCH